MLSRCAKSTARAAEGRRPDANNNAVAVGAADVVGAYVSRGRSYPRFPTCGALPRLLRVSAADSQSDVRPTLVVHGGIGCVDRGPSNVPWCKLQRGPACRRRCGAPAAVIRGANSAAKSMSAGVPPANYR